MRETITLPGGEKRSVDYVFGSHYTDVLPVVLPIFQGVLKAPPRVVEQSLTALLAASSEGYPVSSDISRVAHVLFANEKKLQQGIPIGPFEGMDHDEWVPVTLVDMRKLSSNVKAQCWLGKFYCLGGTSATEFFWRQILATPSSRSFYRLVAFKVPRKWVCLSMPEYAGLRTWVLVRKGERLTFDRIEASNAFSSYNRKVLNARANEPCPRGYEPPVCKNCDVGLKQCYRATHYESYVIAPCNRCANEYAYFEPDDSPDSVSCVTCRWR
jgi:hypothetical protein